MRMGMRMFEMASQGQVKSSHQVKSGQEIR